MSTTPVFDWASSALEDVTQLNALETRGTIRIALKRAGLEAASVTVGEMAILLNRILPPELEARAIENAAELCKTIADRLSHQSFEGASRESAETIFARLGSRS